MHLVIQKKRMIIMKISIAFIALLISLSACTTVPIKASNTSRPADDRILRPNLLAHQPTELTQQVPVLFIRDSAFYGSGCLHEIYINDEPTLKLGTSESIQLYLQVGRTRFRNKIGGIICPIFSTSTETELRPNEEVTVRTGLMEGRPFIRVEKK